MKKRTFNKLFLAAKIFNVIVFWLTGIGLLYFSMTDILLHSHQIKFLMGMLACSGALKTTIQYLEYSKFLENKRRK